MLGILRGSTCRSIPPTAWPFRCSCPTACDLLCVVFTLAPHRSPQSRKTIFCTITRAVRATGFIGPGYFCFHVLALFYCSPSRNAWKSCVRKQGDTEALHFYSREPVCMQPFRGSKINLAECFGTVKVLRRTEQRTSDCTASPPRRGKHTLPQLRIGAIGSRPPSRHTNVHVQASGSSQIETFPSKALDWPGCSHAWTFHPQNACGR